MTVSQSQLGGRDYWVGLRLEHHGRIERLQESLLESLRELSDPPDGGWRAVYRLPDPHITLHPGLRADRTLIASVVEAASAAVGAGVDLDGAYRWPSPVCPRVVALDADPDGDFHGAQRAVREVVQARGDEHAEPVSPHVTLLRARDSAKASDHLPDRVEIPLGADRFRFETWVSDVYAKPRSGHRGDGHE